MARDEEDPFLRYIQRELQEQPEGIDEIRDRGTTVLTYACEKGHLTGATYLLDHGADVEAPNVFGERPLQVASRCGHVALVTLLLSRGAAKASESGPTDSAPSPLVLATLGRHMSVLRVLLAAGVDVEEAGSNGGRTALWWACSRGFDDVAALLLQSQADARSTCTSGDTALQAAREAGSRKCIALLHEAERVYVLQREYALSHPQLLPSPISTQRAKQGIPMPMVHVGGGNEEERSQVGGEEREAGAKRLRDGEGGEEKGPQGEKKGEGEEEGEGVLRLVMGQLSGDLFVQLVGCMGVRPGERRKRVAQTGARAGGGMVGGGRVVGRGSGEEGMQGGRDLTRERTMAMLSRLEAVTVEKKNKAIVGQQEEEEEGGELGKGQAEGGVSRHVAEEGTMEVDQQTEEVVEKVGEGVGSTAKEEEEECADKLASAPDLKSVPGEAVAQGQEEMEAGGEEADTEALVEGEPEGQGGRTVSEKGVEDSGMEVDKDGQTATAEAVAMEED